MPPPPPFTKFDSNRKYGKSDTPAEVSMPNSDSLIMSPYSTGAFSSCSGRGAPYGDGWFGTSCGGGGVPGFCACGGGASGGGIGGGGGTAAGAVVGAGTSGGGGKSVVAWETVSCATRSSADETIFRP